MLTPIWDCEEYYTARSKLQSRYLSVILSEKRKIFAEKGTRLRKFFASIRMTNIEIVDKFYTAHYTDSLNGRAEGSISYKKCGFSNLYLLTSAFIRLHSWEKDNISNACRIGQKHNQPLYADTHAARRRHTIFHCE